MELARSSSQVSGSREARGDLTAPGEAWYRLDGARVATTALVTSSVAAPEEAAPNVTRDRGYLGAPELIWNAAAPQILPDGGTYGSCGNWFSSSSQWRGSAASPRSASEWQAAVRNRTEPCDQPRRLLCVER